MRRATRRMLRLLVLAALLWVVLTTLSCSGTTYVGVGVAGPYAGYPYGGYGGYGYPYGGGVYVGRPF